MKETKKETEIPIQQIVEKIVGTKEQALEEIVVARNLLTKEEFNNL